MSAPGFLTHKKPGRVTFYGDDGNKYTAFYDYYKTDGTSTVYYCAHIAEPVASYKLSAYGSVVVVNGKVVRKTNREL